MTDEVFPEYDLSRDLFYRVVKQGPGKYGKLYADRHYKPTAEQQKVIDARNAHIKANEVWLSNAVRPVTRQRRLRIVGWALGLRKARVSRSR